MGKTSLATNIAFNAADRLRRDLADGIADARIGRRGGRVLQPGNERRPARHAYPGRTIGDQLAKRCAWARSAARTSSSCRYASQRLAELPLYIDDTPALTIAALRTRARRLKRRHDIGLIVVDYLQLLQGSGRAIDNRVNEISEISRGLKTLAKELRVPVIALSQLSRAVEQREDKRPQLSDLRESGSIEQDADMVLFVFREEYYHDAIRPDVPTEESSSAVKEKYSQWEQRHMDVVNKATVIIGKQRHGSTGSVQLHFQAEYTKFGNLARSQQSYSRD